MKASLILNGIMKVGRISILLGSSIFPHCFFYSRAEAAVPVVLSRPDNRNDMELAKELVEKLGHLYPGESFIIEKDVPARGKAILLGLASDERIQFLLGRELPTDAESYIVKKKVEGAREWGVIAGADERGLAYGVYGLLQNLGYGFYLNYDAAPAPRQNGFSWDGWELTDRPLVPDRLVFNWHNFMSGCSTWDLPEWNAWIRQSRKMGYNGIMVHAYGNNPMVRFRFNGKDKPLGYLSSTARGRDWATMHVNDVRRLQGGNVFSHPVFGAQAAQVPDEKRSDSARELMQSVFSEAVSHSMNIFFAIDVDTLSGNPQELILTLPENARFRLPSKDWMANPDTPEGYRYYKEQARQLFDDYPQITCLALWFRRYASPLVDFKPQDLHPAWRKEYDALMEGKSEAAKEWNSAGCFVVSKIARGWQRALRELGLGKVRLAVGNWMDDFLPASDRFLPKEITLIPLDYNVRYNKSMLKTPDSKKLLASVGIERPLIPIIWAQHDDGHYLGRSYTPFSRFQERLEQSHSSGFGIIHWSNRPFDLFFSSHIRQTWNRTVNEELSVTCREMAVSSFGSGAAKPMANYLESWITEAPQFGRETGNTLIDRKLQDHDVVSTLSKKRMLMLDAALKSIQTPEQKKRSLYWRGLEEFITEFSRAEGLLQQARHAIKEGKSEEARKAMSAAKPEEVLEQFARFNLRSGILRGDQGLVVSLNTRWLTYFKETRQVLRMEPIRSSCGTTYHEALAQEPGNWTFFIDKEGAWWQRLGTLTIKGKAFSFPDAEKEIGRAGIVCAKRVSFPIQPMLYMQNVAAGKYRARFFFSDPYSSAAGENVFQVSFGGKTETVDVFKETGARGKVLERVFDLSLTKPEKLQVTLTPVTGKAFISGVILEPVD